MASRHPPRRHTFASPPTPRSRGHTVASDTIDDILGMCLNWILPVIFFCVIIILVTMLTTYTLVMRQPLPRVFTFVIVITFSALITITFFILVIFHIHRCQRVRSILSEVKILPPSPKLERIIKFLFNNLGKFSAQSLTCFLI